MKRVLCGVAFDFTSGRAHRTAPSDPYSQGTHVAGLIGSRYVGVAPKVNLVDLRAPGQPGCGTRAGRL